MTILRFRDICDVIPGTYLAKKDYSETGCFSVQGAGSEMGTHDEPNFRYAITVIGKVGTVGKPRYFPNGCWVNNNAAAVVAKNGIIDPFILNLILNMIDWSKFRAQTAQPFLLINDFLDYEFRVDGIGFRDQEKTSSSMKEYDAKLTALREKADGLRQFKTGLMQQLFSQELRFTREDGSDYPEWEERKLGDLVGWVRTNSLSREHLTDGDASGVQNIHYGDIHSKFRAIFRQSNEEVPFITTSAPLRTISDEDFVRPGDVVIADASEDYADIGKAIEIMEVRERSMIAGLHTFIARPEQGVLAPGFAGYLLRSAPLRRQIVRAAQGVSVLGLSKGNLEKLTLGLPAHEEQEKIAGALMAVDAKIDAITEQITHMETFKKGLLQKMFA